jgi:hypothetical protein
MGLNSGSEVDRGKQGSRPVPEGGASPARRLQDRRWPWVIVIVAAAAAKGAVIANVFHHRSGAIVVLAVLAAVSLLRGRPLWLAMFGGPLLAVALHPHPLLLGIAVGVGAFFVLIVLFAALGTALNMGDALRSRARNRQP